MPPLQALLQHQRCDGALVQLEFSRLDHGAQPATRAAQETPPHGHEPGAREHPHEHLLGGEGFRRQRHAGQIPYVLAVALYRQMSLGGVRDHPRDLLQNGLPQVLEALLDDEHHVARGAEGVTHHALHPAPRAPLVVIRVVAQHDVRARHKPRQRRNLRAGPRLVHAHLVDPEVDLLRVLRHVREEEAGGLVRLPQRPLEPPGPLHQHLCLRPPRVVHVPVLRLGAQPPMGDKHEHRSRPAAHVYPMQVQRLRCRDRGGFVLAPFGDFAYTLQLRGAYHSH
mmetsp:Transcript_19732/g.43132  ORF Transcript_19732/g.43132 Transcript_19732/m.43132 type:complete len:281 (+) Transcript_19732:1388-2230(+)